MNSEQSLALQNLQALARISELERELEKFQDDHAACIDTLVKIAMLDGKHDLMTARDIALTELKRQDRL